MDQNLKSALAMQSVNQFLIETAYRVMLNTMPDDMRQGILSDLRDHRSIVIMQRGSNNAESLAVREEIKTMIHDYLDAFVERLERPQMTS